MSVPLTGVYSRPCKNAFFEEKGHPAIVKSIEAAAKAK